MLNEIQQIKQEIENCKHVLIVFNNHENTDATASALALFSFLDKNHKSVDIACPNFLPSKNIGFLSGLKNIKSELEHLQKFIIKVDVSKNKIESLSYDIKDDWLSIYLTPKNGVVTKNDLRTAQTTFKYDVIITIGVGELDNLGETFHNNTDLFYRVPVVNVDHRATNEHFGQINLVELTATSLSEIIHQIIQNIGPEL